jgi:hypothetical protein
MWLGQPSPHTSIIVSVIAAMEDADPPRAAFLALSHHARETHTTDLPHLTKQHVTGASNETVTRDQVQPLPVGVAACFMK